jgi:hypothetical protein
MVKDLLPSASRKLSILRKEINQKKWRSGRIGAYSFCFCCELSSGGAVFSVQFSVFSREKTHAGRGLLAAHASRTVADEPPVVPASLDQLEYTNWVGWDGSKLGKEFCTTLHIFSHAYTSQHDSGTCRHKPEHASTFLQSPSRYLANASRLAHNSAHLWLFRF